MIDTRNLEIDGQMVGYFVRSEHQVVATFEDPDASNGESDSFSWGREPDGELPD